LSASVGVSSTKLVSKVASDLAKPRGILYVLPGHEAALLAPLRIGKLPGIGEMTEQYLKRLGITTVGELSEVGREFLCEALGHWGESLYQKSIGHDTAHFDFHEEPKSISHENTFDQDTNDLEVIHATLAHLVQKVARRLRDHKMYAGTITLKLRDLDFHTITRTISLEKATYLDSEILENVKTHLKQNWDGQLKIRLLGVALSGLSYGPVQEDLFEKPRRDKMSRLYQAADRIRDKFGSNSVTSARTVK